MRLLVVGAGEMGRWVADTVAADVAFADRDPAAAEDAAASRDARAVPLDGRETFDVVCLAVPMSAVGDAVSEQAPRAERAIFDVSGAMGPPLAAMRSAFDGERASLHPLFAPPRVPGNVAVVRDEIGPVLDAVLADVEAAGNRVFETTVAEHDRAMETVQAAAHAAVISYALAADDVREEFHTPVSAALGDVVETVTEGSPAVYAEIQATFDGADRVAEAAAAVAAADRAEFEALYREAAEGTESRERHD